MKDTLQIVLTIITILGGVIGGVTGLGMAAYDAQLTSRADAKTDAPHDIWKQSLKCQSEGHTWYMRIVDGHAIYKCVK